MTRYNTEGTNNLTTFRIETILGLFIAYINLNIYVSFIYKRKIEKTKINEKFSKIVNRSSIPSRCYEIVTLICRFKDRR